MARGLAVQACACARSGGENAKHGVNFGFAE
jgi:hypothetical protein